MSADLVTVLRALDGAMAKVITRAGDGGLDVRPYARATWFGVEEIAVDGIVEMGCLLARLEREPDRCLVRGWALPGTDRARTRRLLHDREDGRATFGAEPRRWIALDFDSLDLPEWDQEHLARRREAILADYAARNTGVIGLPVHFKPAADLDDEAERAVWEMDIAGDGAPAPIDPARDPEPIVRAVISTLPIEFSDSHCWWQLTSGAGIKPGTRIRLWFWLSRPVSDDEVKRWLADAPVDHSLYSVVQPHYVARPIFKPPSLDPVPRRSGMWWHHVAEVPVPELPDPEPPAAPAYALPIAGADRRAAAYADACLRAVLAAAPDDRHKTLRRVAVSIFGLAEHEMLDEQEAWDGLRAAADAHVWPERRREDLLVWARATAADKKPLPKGFTPCR